MKKLILLFSAMIFPANSFAEEFPLSKYIKTSVNARYRYEYVDDAAKSNKANASTLRTRIGFQTNEYSGLSSFFEFENTVLLGPANFDNYANNKPTYAAVNDQNNNEINQFYINYKAPLNNEIRFGRQELVFDDKRFIGNSGWTQNGQTYDGIKITNTTLPYLKATYAYLNKAIRSRGIYADDGGTFYHMDANLVNLNFAALKDVDGYSLNLIPYFYSISLEETPTFSSNTTGLRAEAKKKLSETASLQLLLDAATQSDFDNNPDSYELGYYQVKPAINYGNFTFGIGYKVFEGNGVSSFQTPLASQHGFHGWSDVINRIPVNGLNDKFAEIIYSIPEDVKCPWLKDTKLTAAYYNLDSDDNSQSYAEEYNYEIAKAISKNYTLALAYADYRAQGLFADTQKVTLTLDIKY